VPFSADLVPVLYEYACTQVLQNKKHKKDVGIITNANVSRLQGTGSNPEARIAFLEPKKH